MAYGACTGNARIRNNIEIGKIRSGIRGNVKEQIVAAIKGRAERVQVTQDTGTFIVASTVKDTGEAECQ